MITITHTRAEGTLLKGSRKGDGVWDILKGLRGNWTSFRSLGCLGIRQSRDKAAYRHRIDAAAEALRAAGWEVTIEINEDESRSFAEQEADRYARAEDRALRMEEYAGNAAARSDAAYQSAHRIVDGIPMGQPILVGHHSEGRHRRALERMHNGMRRSIEEEGKAEYFAHRAEAAENYQANREDVPTTLRRIKKLEAEQRRIRRALAGRPDVYRGDDGAWHVRVVKPEGGRLAELNRLDAEYTDQIAYWRKIVADAEATGVKVWGPADFTKGDFIRWFGTWAQVLRVNPKSVTIAWGINFTGLNVITKANARDACGDNGWTDTVPYDKIRARKTADEIAPILAAQTAAIAAAQEAKEIA